MNRFILGNYLNHDSLIHRLDPRFKTLALVFLLSLSLLTNNYYTSILILVVVLIIIYLSRIKLLNFLASMKYILAMILLIFVMNIFVYSDGELIFEFFFIKIYTDAITQSLFISLRFTIVIILSFIYTSTTKANDISKAIYHLLKFLKVVKFPVNEVAIIISLALRFIPTFITDAYKLIDAQSVRGAKFYYGSFKERTKALISLIIPLFIKAFSHAEILAIAMEIRYYDPLKDRSEYKVMKLNLNDYLSILFLIVITIIFGYLNYAI